MYLDIIIVIIDCYTRQPIYPAYVSVFVVSAASVYSLFTVHAVHGEAKVKISFEATLLLVVRAPGYSTVSRIYVSYCYTGIHECSHFPKKVICL